MGKSKEYEAITCENVFSEFSEEHLQRLAENRGIDTYYSNRQLRDESLKAMLVASISSFTRKSGSKLLIKSFNKTSLLQLVENIHEEVLRKGHDLVDKDGEPRPLSKVVMAKRLTEAVNEAGDLLAYVDQFRSKRKRKTLFGGLITFVNDKVPEGESVEELKAELSEVLETFYLTNILSALPVNFLREVCHAIKCHPGDCTSSNILAECIIEGKWYEPKESVSNAGPTRDKKPKRISERVSKADLAFWFKATELKDFCQEKGLRTTGKKTELAKRIVDFFDPEKENDIPKPKGRKKKASRTNEEVEQLSQRSKKSRAPRGKKTKKAAPVPLEDSISDMDISSSVSSEF